MAFTACGDPSAGVEGVQGGGARQHVATGAPQRRTPEAVNEADLAVDGIRMRITPGGHAAAVSVPARFALKTADLKSGWKLGGEEALGGNQAQKLGTSDRVSGPRLFLSPEGGRRKKD